MSGFKRRIIESEEHGLKAITLGELRELKIDVFCWCNRCGHNAVVETARLITELGPGQPVPEIGGAMRCTGCGAKDIASRPAWPSLGTVARHI